MNALFLHIHEQYFELTLIKNE